MPKGVYPRTKDHRKHIGEANRLRPGQWSRRHDCCQECGTIEIPYEAKGLCRRCYERKWNHTEIGRLYVSMKCNKRRALERNAYYWYPIDDIFWPILCSFTHGICPRCGRNVGINNLTLDHIKPLNRKGLHAIWNVQPLCKSCNSSKGDRIEGPCFCYLDVYQLVRDVVFTRYSQG